MIELLRTIPARFRRILYAIVTFGLAVYAIWGATQGDPETFAVAFATALATALATINTDVPEPTEQVDAEG